ncbi:MAG: TonB-dependent receptor [Pyrinomonadaceae bacterium]
MTFTKSFILIGIITLLFNLPIFAQQNGSLGGQIVDTLGAVVVGASITVISASGTEKTATSNQRGEFTVTALTPGKYTVRIASENFAPYENTEVEIIAGQREELIVPLTVEGLTEQVEVASGEGVSTDPQNNAGATVLREKELEALPDDPDDLEAALQALAGPSAGPNGGQIYIDGFTGGRLPPKESIREIRINSNPLSAEYDRLGFGRIEILTKPGSDKWRGSAFVNFNDESLNSRNPFAANRAPSQRRFFGGNVSGPIQKGKSSFFFDISNRDEDNNAVVNALILDPSLNPVVFSEEFQIPSRRFSFSPRFDYAINDKNTLVARYSFERASFENQGIGNFSLPSRAYATKNIEHEIRLTETMIINPTTINETRFEYSWEMRDQEGDNTIPTINVADAFTGGGSQIGLSFNRATTWELQNYTTTSFGKSSEHGLKFGIRLRGINITDRSENNFGGNFTFTNLDNYRGAILDTAAPTQFSITVGNPQQSVSRTDMGLFITDDWRVNPGLTLSFGLRYENQNNIDDDMNFAPRFSFAWSPGAGGARPPKTVIRGGVGWFYERFGENLTLQALRFNGSEQLNLIVNSRDSDPARRAAAIALLQQPVFTLGGVTNVPTTDQILTALPQSNTIRSVSPDLQSPRMFQAAFGVERQLPARTTVSLFYIGSRTVNVFRTRNINAPVCPFPSDCENVSLPDPTSGNIFQYESSGVLNQNQMIVNFRSMFSTKFSLFGNYRLGFASGDSDGAGSFPAYSYDLSNEFGRSSFDIRHNFVIGGNFTIPWNISLSPFIIANSGRPFNITTGIDGNRDSIINDRPSFATDLGRQCNFGTTALPSIRDCVVRTQYGDFDLQPIAGQTIIPRNYAQGPTFFSVNLRVGKNFGFGSSPQMAVAEGQTGGGRQGGGGFPVGGGGLGGRGGGGRGAGGGGARRGGGGFGGGEVRKPYNLNVGLNFQNLFNNVNFGSPVGNLSSSRFGQSTSTSGGFGGFGGGGGGGSANRRIELQMRFNW